MTRLGGLMVAALVATLAVAGCGGTKAARGPSRVAIQVTEDGFVPATVTVHAGQPVTLVITRTTDQTCATEIVMKAMNIKRELPLNEAVEVTFTPDKPGTLRYACGMDMVSGQVVVE